MVLAQRIEFYVTHKNHPPAFVGEDCLLCHSVGIGIITYSGVYQCLGSSFRCFQQTFSAGIFAYQPQYFSIMVGQLGYKFGVMCLFLLIMNQMYAVVLIATLMIDHDIAFNNTYLS